MPAAAKQYVSTNWLLFIAIVTIASAFLVIIFMPLFANDAEKLNLKGGETCFKSDYTINTKCKGWFAMVHQIIEEKPENYPWNKLNVYESYTIILGAGIFSGIVWFIVGILALVQIKNQGYSLRIIYYCLAYLCYIIFAVLYGVAKSNIELYKKDFFDIIKNDTERAKFAESSNGVTVVGILALILSFPSLLLWCFSIREKGKEKSPLKEGLLESKDIELNAAGVLNPSVAGGDDDLVNEAAKKKEKKKEGGEPAPKEEGQPKQEIRAVIEPVPPPAEVKKVEEEVKKVEEEVKKVEEEVKKENIPEPKPAPVEEPKPVEEAKKEPPPEIKPISIRQGVSEIILPENKTEVKTEEPISAPAPEVKKEEPISAPETKKEEPISAPEVKKEEPTPTTAPEAQKPPDEVKKREDSNEDEKEEEKKSAQAKKKSMWGGLLKAIKHDQKTVAKEYFEQTAEGKIQWKETHFILIFDCSGSMRGKRWKNLTIAYETLLKNLETMKDIKISSVCFDGQAYVHNSCVGVSEALATANKLPKNFGADTRYDVALQAALDILAGQGSEFAKYLNCIVFLSDGTASYPEEQVNKLLTMKKEGRKFIYSSIALVTEDDDTLKKMATTLEGDHYQVASPESLASITHNIMNLK